MDFQLKQWREIEQKQQKEEEQQQSSSSSSKMPRLVLQLEESDQSTTSALPLFVNPRNQQQQNPPTSFQDSSKFTPPNKAGGVVEGGGGGYFSVAQWQELELQALIFRHMVAGAAIPPELLQLVKRSFIDSPSFYLQSHPYFQPASVLQSGMMMGYWGSRGGGGAMDPEPGRCRRTDGKKWRCSRDVVAGHKYCERHVHRGRNRSRKPVEFSLPNNPNPYPYPCPTFTTSSTHFSLSGGSSASLLHSSNHLNLLGVSRSKSDSKMATELERNEPPTMALAAMGNDEKSNGHVLRRFFDDWPQESKDINAAGNPPTCLSISTPGIGNNHHPSSSDFLKLSTGNNGGGEDVSIEQQPRQQQLLLRSQFNWNRMGPTGGPLGEALRSPSGGSSLTSVHQVTTTSSRSVSDTSYVSA